MTDRPEHETCGAIEGLRPDYLPLRAESIYASWSVQSVV